MGWNLDWMFFASVSVILAILNFLFSLFSNHNKSMPQMIGISMYFGMIMNFSLYKNLLERVRYEEFWVFESSISTIENITVVTNIMITLSALLAMMITKKKNGTGRLLRQ